MRLFRQVIIGLSLGLAAVTSVQASAAIVTRTINFESSRLFGIGPVGVGPVFSDPVSGNFTMQFDNDPSAPAFTRQYAVVNQLSIPIGNMRVIADYFPIGSFLGLYGEDYDSDLRRTINDFRLTIREPDTPAPFGFLEYYDQTTQATFIGSVSVKITDSVAGAVPEPATWLSMIFGFAAVGAEIRRRNRDPKRIQIA